MLFVGDTEIIYQAYDIKYVMPLELSSVTSPLNFQILKLSSTLGQDVIPTGLL